MRAEIVISTGRVNTCLSVDADALVLLDKLNIETNGYPPRDRDSNGAQAQS